MGGLAVALFKKTSVVDRKHLKPRTTVTKPQIQTHLTQLLLQEGMEIRSNSEKIRKMRKNIAELLVAQAPSSRAIQDVAIRCGVKEVRYPFRNEDCVLCGKCVRACDEIWQAKAIGFVGRGKDRHVDHPFGVRPDFCKQCGYCITLCPMTIPACDGPMKDGEEYLCGKCEAQLMVTEVWVISSLS